MKTLITLSAAALLATGSAAFAGGIAAPVVEPAPALVPAPVAIAPMSADWSGFYVGGQYGAGSLEDGTDDVDLTTYGVHAGYLYDLGNFVLGGEAAYVAADVDGVDSDGSYVGRAGVIAGYDAGRFLPYVTGGYGYLNTDDGTTSASDSGYYYGIGATYAVTSNVQVGLEYLDHRFDDFDDSGVDLRAKTTSLKVSYSF
ncbi:outer membrane protein [Loktanella sp. DJP18]|uniref:outer membrane protein n=1 Tax=Loktanella sp. DJP18 TaxID=3409788 RepID=UPI003BB6AE1A